MHRRDGRWTDSSLCPQAPAGEIRQKEDHLYPATQILRMSAEIVHLLKPEHAIVMGSWQLAGDKQLTTFLERFV